MNPQLKMHMDRRIRSLSGAPSSLIAQRCPKKIKHYPERACWTKTCPWWVNGLHYKNCSFVAAEMGEHTLAEIGKMIGISRERVRQIETEAIRKIRISIGLPDEPLYQQSMARRSRKDTPEDPPVIEEHPIDIFYLVCLREVGIQVG